MTSKQLRGDRKQEKIEIAKRELKQLLTEMLVEFEEEKRKEVLKETNYLRKQIKQVNKSTKNLNYTTNPRNGQKANPNQRSLKSPERISYNKPKLSDNTYALAKNYLSKNAVQDLTVFQRLQVYEKQRKYRQFINEVSHKKAQQYETRITTNSHQMLSPYRTTPIDFYQSTTPNKQTHSPSQYHSKPIKEKPEKRSISKKSNSRSVTPQTKIVTPVKSTQNLKQDKITNQQLKKVLVANKQKLGQLLNQLRHKNNIN